MGKRIYMYFQNTRMSPALRNSIAGFLYTDLSTKMMYACGLVCISVNWRKMARPQYVHICYGTLALRSLV